jgi:hypothetical protein
LQPLFSARDQRQLMTMTREYARERRANSGGGAGDNGNGARDRHTFIVAARPAASE